MGIFSNRKIRDPRSSVCRSVLPPTPEDDFLHGVLPLSEQIRKVLAGGQPPQSRELRDSNYDEDDSQDVDPLSEFGIDRFERAEAMTDLISDRIAKKKKKQLETADV